MTSLAKLRRKRLTDPEVKAEYDRLGPIFTVVGEMIEARQAAGLKHTEIASRMGTSQSVVARRENARHMPTFEMIARYAAIVVASISTSCRRIHRFWRIAPPALVVVSFVFGARLHGGGAAERLVAARRQPLQPLGLGQQHPPQAALDLAF